MAKTIKNVGVIGLGVMGFDIAFLYALKGYPTTAYDASATVMQSFSGRVEKTIESLKKRGRISEAQVENVRKGLKIASEVQAMAALDLITEAIDFA